MKINKAKTKVYEDVKFYCRLYKFIERCYQMFTLFCRNLDKKKQIK